MQGHELRKLITTFLVLALLAGSASLAITSLSRSKSEGPVAKVDQQANTQIPKIGDKALVEDIAGSRIQGYDLAAEFSPSVSSDDNYTDSLAKGLAYSFVKANPQGPDLSTGTGIIPPQDLDNVVAGYVTDAALSPTTYAIDSSRLKIAKNYTKEQVDQYLQNFNDTLAGINSDKGIQGLAARSQDADLTEASVAASNFIYADAQEKLYNTVVPEPAAKLHVALLTYLELNRKLSDLDYTTDPLKAVVFTNKFPSLQEHEAQNIKVAFNDFAKQMPNLVGTAPAMFQFASLVNVAHAQLGPIPTVESPGPLLTNAAAQLKVLGLDLKADVSTAISTKGSWSQKLLEWAKKLATQILKNQLVSRLIQQTIKWVQGGGKPQFITNWRNFLKDSAIGATNELINSAAPHLCKNLQAFNTDFLKRNTQNTVSGSRDQYQQFNCTLDQVVQSVKGFYDDFLTGGGWTALASLVMEPQNNTWGSLIVTHEAAIQQATQAQAATNANAQANRGYTGFSRCVKPVDQNIAEADLPNAKKDPNYQGLGPRGCFSTTGTGGTDPGEYAYCLNNPDETFTPAGNACADILATPPILDNRRCDIIMCASDGQQQTTPGGFVADQVTDAVGGTLKNIVSAEDLSGLVAALVDSAINKLTTLATNGLLGLFNGGSNGGGTGGGGTGTGGTSGDVTALRAQAQNIVTNNQTQVTQSSQQNSSWAATASSTSILLNSVIPTCPNYADDATQRLGAIGRIAISSQEDQTALDGLTAQLASTSAAIAAATDGATIADLISSMDSLGSDIANLSTRIGTRVAQIAGLSEAAQADLTNRACNTPLPPLDE